MSLVSSEWLASAGSARAPTTNIEVNPIARVRSLIPILRVVPLVQAGYRVWNAKSSPVEVRPLDRMATWFLEAGSVGGESGR